MSFTTNGLRRDTKTRETFVLGLSKKITPLLEEFQDYRNPLLFLAVLQVIFDNLLHQDSQRRTSLREALWEEIDRVTLISSVASSNSNREILESSVELSQLFWESYRYEIRNRYKGIVVDITGVTLRRASLTLILEINNG